METDDMDSRIKNTLTQIKLCKAKLAETNYTSLNEILSSKECQLILSQFQNKRHRTYTYEKTLFTFLQQVLNPDKSCKNAVADLVVQGHKNNNEISLNTGAYCKARQRLPEELIRELIRITSTFSAKNILPHWQLTKRPLKAVDGTTANMPDTKENQKAFPQIPGQKKGVGFPIVRIVAILSITDGVILDHATGQYKGKGTGESTLFRSLYHCINDDDIFLLDALYPSFWVVADIKAKNADIIAAGKCRHYDFRKGEKLGTNDHIVEWEKPNRPEWMDKATYDAYPEKVRVREYRIGGKTYITTLLDKKEYSKKKLKELYEQRWLFEVNLRNLKQVMKMEMLSCKTPELIKKEISIHILAYNFIRIIIAEACVKNGMPNKISFKSTVQLIRSFTPLFINSTEKEARRLYQALLKEIVKNNIGNRPGRIEPRKLKKRSKCYKLLTKPRDLERKEIKREIKKRNSRYALK